MIVGFDHCYQRIMQASDYFNLRLRGFRVTNESFEHPGQRICRFLHFQKNEDPGWGLPFHYLEFVEIQNMNTYKATFPPGTSERKMLEPGFSISFGYDLERVYEGVRDKMQIYEPAFEHKNYHWKEGGHERLPGWNFLTFQKNLIPDLYIWGTEYEPVAGATRSGVIPGHMNTANHIMGFVWDHELAQLQNFIELSRAQVCESGILELRDGSKIFLNHHCDLPMALRESQKNYPFKAVVLQCADWEQFLTMGQPDHVYKWRGKKMGQIQMSPWGWDIWVIE